MVLLVSYVYLIMTYTCFTFTCITAMFYYLLGNIRPRYRSQLKAIQLVAVVNTSIIDSNGIDAILAPLVDDIKKLEKVIIIALTCLLLDNAKFHLLYRAYTSLWMGSRECFEEQLDLYLLITWPASCLEGTNNSHPPFVVAAIAWHTVMTCVYR